MTPQGYVLIAFLIAACIELLIGIYKSIRNIIENIQRQKRLEEFGGALLREHMKQEPTKEPPPEDEVPIDKGCLTNR